MDRSQNLLLLPPIPEPATYPEIKAAYHVPLLLALRKLKESISGRSILDIALPCPYLWDQLHLPRSLLYSATQEAVANMYKLICVIAAQHGIEVADVEGDSIDVRLILLAYPRDGNLKGRSLTSSRLGPVVELHILARGERPWATVFSVETEQGELLLKNFMSISEKILYRYEKLRGGVVQPSRPAGTPSNSKAHRCHSVAVGGTFDHLHIGH